MAPFSLQFGGVRDTAAFYTAALRLRGLQTLPSVCAKQGMTVYFRGETALA